MISVIEKWRPIEGYEGLYEVSDWGRVKSLEKVDSLGHLRKEKILKSIKNNKGYIKVNLCKDGERKNCTVHRLVAQAFIPNPDNLPCVNHKDEVKTNNHVGNLEFCSHQYNSTYGTAIQRRVEKTINGKLSKSVYQYTLDGEFVREWESVSEIQRQLGYFQTAISACCAGKCKTSYDYIWSFTPLDEVSYQERIVDKRQNNKLSKTVLQYTLDGIFIAEYPSVNEVERQLGFDCSTISKVCRGIKNTHKNFVWKYAEE